MEVDVEATSFVNYVHMRCVGCAILRRFKDEGLVVDLTLPDIKPGKGMPTLFALVFKYAMMRVEDAHLVDNSSPQSYLCVAPIN